jgi:hypothetical protein
MPAYPAKPLALARCTIRIRHGRRAEAAAPVRTLRLGGLDLEASRTLLQDKGLQGDDAAWQALVGRYGGNPLALKVVSQAIAELFGGQIAAFLTYATETYGAVFGGLRRLLEEQVERLSPLEQSVLSWLAVEREPVGVAALAADLGPGTGRGALLEALEGLGQRSLLERGAQGGTHTLQPVVLEYATERLVAEVGREVVAGAPGLLASHALLQAQAKDYVRRSQERLNAQPLLEHVRTSGQRGGGRAAAAGAAGGVAWPPAGGAGLWAGQRGQPAAAAAG